MNAMAAGHEWRDLAIWVVPAAVYAPASDPLIGVVRSQVVARQRADHAGVGDDKPGVLAAAGGTVLWALRLLLAGPSTLREFRSWVVEECLVAPGRKAALDRQAQRVITAVPAQVPCPLADQRTRLPDGPRTKREQLLKFAARSGATLFRVVHQVRRGVHASMEPLPKERSDVVRT